MNPAMICATFSNVSSISSAWNHVFYFTRASASFANLGFRFVPKVVLFLVHGFTATITD
jgi:hypothetical protein